jgi:hypothetical protein
VQTNFRFTSFPRTKPPAPFVSKIVKIFKDHEPRICTISLIKGLESDAVLQVLADDLANAGFLIERAKGKADKVSRPVFFGENGEPSLRYEIDAYQPEWRCGLEVEAGRSILGNAIFRDLFQAMVMTDVDHLCLAVPNTYKYNASGKSLERDCYAKTVSVADALYGHSRVAMPYGLTVIGY